MMKNPDEAFEPYVDTPGSPFDGKPLSEASKSRWIITPRMRIIIPDEIETNIIEPIRIKPIVKEAVNKQMSYIPTTTLAALHAQIAEAKEEVTRRMRKMDELQQEVEILKRQLTDGQTNWLRAYHELAHSLPMTVINVEAGEEMHVNLNRDNRTVIIKSRPPLQDNSGTPSPESSPQEWPYITDV